MVDRTSFIDDAGMAELRDLYTDGMATVQSWNQYPVITILRRGEDGLIATVPGLVTVEVISIKRDTTQEEAFVPNQGAGELAMTGTLKAWAPFPARVDDRFLWDGMVCEITTAPPTHTVGIVDVFGFEILQRNA